MGRYIVEQKINPKPAPNPRSVKRFQYPMRQEAKDKTRNTEQKCNGQNNYQGFGLAKLNSHAVQCSLSTTF